MQYREKHEDMNPLDSATFYYYFTKQGFLGDGLFYKYLQKSVSRTIGQMKGPELALMFVSFPAEENRLNTGVKGRLTDHLRFLVREG